MQGGKLFRSNLLDNLIIKVLKDPSSLCKVYIYKDSQDLAKDKFKILINTPQSIKHPCKVFC